MAEAGRPEAARSTLETLLVYLDADPDNLSLTSAAARQAFEEGRLDEASALIDQYTRRAPAPPELRNLRGLVALSSHRFDLAAAQFEALLEERPGDTGVRFNLAWSKAMLQDYGAASELIDDTVIAAVPRAATLKVQALHHLGRMAEALDLGRELGNGVPPGADLMGALSAVAIDNNDPDLASSYAKKAGDAPDGRATLGMLDLDRGDLPSAHRHFAKALDVHPDHARALLGRGLASLAAGDAEAAIPDIDRSAILFERHLGTWLAAGWARLVNGDLVGARRKIENAMEIDDTFAETHGALAVVDAMQGRDADARRRIDVALRLDRSCFSAALAQILLLRSQGKADTADRVLSAVFNTAIGPSGRTMADALSAFGRLRRPKA